MVHQHLLHLHGNSRDGFMFLDYGGTPVGTRLEPKAVAAALHTALALPPDSGNAHEDNLLHRYLMVGARRRLASEQGLCLLPDDQTHVRRPLLHNRGIPRSGPRATRLSRQHSK